MAAFLSILRDGDFLTRERIRLWTIAILTGFALGLFALALTAHGMNDYQGRPLGTDFSSFYAAGRTVLAHASPYDQAALHRMQESLFGKGTAYYAFAYPPLFLLIAVPLAAAPYLVALLIWQGTTLALYLVAMGRLRRRFATTLADETLFFALALGFTATFVNVTHGQNGVLSAALLAFAVGTETAWLSGLCFGLLAFKPQLGLLVPFALAAGGRWRSFAAAATVILALAAIATLAFGIDSWRGFLDASAFSRREILDHNAVGYQKMVSVFAGMRLWGAPLAVAYCAQLAASLVVLVAMAWLWRSNADYRRKGAALCLGTLLATPFAFDYDMMVLAPAIALLAAEGVEHGFRSWERSILVLLWFVPILTRNVAEYTHVPLGVMAMLMAFALTVRNGLSSDVRRRVFAAA